jgi:hypothetical protein
MDDGGLRPGTGSGHPLAETSRIERQISSMHQTSRVILFVVVSSAIATAATAFGGGGGGGGSASLSGQDASGCVSHSSFLGDYLGTTIKKVSIRNNCTQSVHVTLSDQCIQGFGINLSPGSTTTAFLGNPVTCGASYEFRAVYR